MVVTVQVGPAPEGPDRKGGGTSRDRGAPDHGAAIGTGAAVGGSPSSAASAGSTPPRSRPDSQPAARAGNPSDEKSNGLSLPGAALGLIITGGLLGLGAFSEGRSFLP